MRGKGVETGDDPAVRGENKDGGKVAFLILPGLALKIGIQFRNATAKGRSIMMRPERLSPKFDLSFVPGHYFPARSL